MGEAKSRRLALEEGPCLCLSGRRAVDCCLTSKPVEYWHKSSAQLSLRAEYAGNSQTDCYMAELKSCDGAMSKEHLVSESVLKVLADGGDIKVGGLPWLEEGKLKAIGVKSFTAKCLCQRHNSSLSPLDDAARNFFSYLKQCFESIDETIVFICSGHDIERWLLKCLKALSVSGNLIAEGDVLEGKFSRDIDVLEMLDDTQAWPDGAGLYCVMTPGAISADYREIQMVPTGSNPGEISGLWTSFFGVSYALMFEGFDASLDPEMQHAIYRPGAIIVEHPHATRRIILSWEDGKTHLQAISLTAMGAYAIENDPNK